MRKLLVLSVLLLSACASHPGSTDCKPCVCEPCEEDVCPPCPPTPECPQLECEACPACPPPDTTPWVGQVVCSDKIVWYGKATELEWFEDTPGSVIRLTDVSDGSRQIFLDCYGIFEKEQTD